MYDQYIGFAVMASQSSLPVASSDAARVSLETILRRKDVWRGHSQHFVPGKAVDSGFNELNAALLYRGWPESCLIELGQNLPVATWFLLAPALRQYLQLSLAKTAGFLVLLNPPLGLSVLGLQPYGIPLDRVLVVEAPARNDFVSTFLELAKSPLCHLLLAWQPAQTLTYPILRKCQLAVLEQRGLYILFRPLKTFAQNSPAALRIGLNLHFEHVQLRVVKQKGCLPDALVTLALPDNWFAEYDYQDLLKRPLAAAHRMAGQRAAVLPLPQRGLSSP